VYLHDQRSWHAVSSLHIYGVIYMNIIDILYGLWARRVFVLAVTALFVLGGVVFAINEDEVFEARVTVVPSEPPDALGALGSIANIGGIAGLGLGLDGHAATAMTVLKSETVARKFISDNSLLPEIFPDEWDAAKMRWRVGGKTDPDLWDGVDIFRRKVLRVEEVKKTGSINIFIRWNRSDRAAVLANSYVALVNSEMRDGEIQLKRSNIEYLKKQLEAEESVEVRAAISGVVENEMKGLMLAVGNPDFAYRVVDQAYAPKERVYPFRSLIVIGFAIAGLVVSSLMIFAVPAVRDRFRAVASADVGT
jgi:uncharacterized protein involved in exopolysaccharide biosynthesis